MELSGQQWNNVVDFANMALANDVHDATMSKPDLEAEISVGEEGFTITVTPVSD
jgi:hypothetical protein